MNKKSLVKIINKELTILVDIVNEFSAEGDVHPFEVDMALSKIKDIYGQLLLLKETESSIPASVELNLDSFQETKNPDDSDNLIKNKVATPIEPSRPEAVVTGLIRENLKGSETETVIKPNSNDESFAKETAVAIEGKPDLDTASAVIDPVELSNQKTNLKVEEETVKATSQPTKKMDKPAVSDTTPNLKGAIIADKFQNLSPSLNDMLAGIHKNKDLASAIKDQPIRNLKSAIKLNDRIWFTNELFNKNKALFEKTIDTVNQFSDLDQALAYLFTNFSWDQNQKSTINFLELVFRRFAN